MAKAMTARQLTCLQALWAQRMHQRGIGGDDSRELRHEYIRAATAGRANQTKELSFADAKRVLRMLFAEQAGTTIPDGSAGQAAGTHGRHGHDDGREEMLIGSQQVALLAVLARQLGWEERRLDAFAARQLGPGREARTIRTMREFNRVLWGMKRMLRSSAKANGAA